jgi:hypothetical protein
MEGYKLFTANNGGPPKPFSEISDEINQLITSKVHRINNCTNTDWIISPTENEGNADRIAYRPDMQAGFVRYVLECPSGKTNMRPEILIAISATQDEGLLTFISCDRRIFSM